MIESSNFAGMLSDLQGTLGRHMPICTAMQIAAQGWDGERLVMQMPLAPNHNHQFSAFAGSLSALCTITGWGAVFMLLAGRGLAGNIVIRRSAIRYRQPVRTDDIVAHSLPSDPEGRAYFFELLEHKGRSKIEIAVEIPGEREPYVSFTGSYVVQDVAPRSQ